MDEGLGLGYKLAHGTDELPSLTPVVSEVLRLSSDSRTSARQLANVIGRDVGLSSRVLRLSNSAYYAHSREVENLEQAIVILGHNEVRNLVLVAGAYAAFKNGLDDELFNRLWEHMLLTAFAADRISQQISPSDHQLAYIAGLLHDVGKMVIGLYFPQEYKRHLDELSSTPCRITYRERKVFGIDHQDVGGMLLDRWQFPKSLVDVAARHHGTDMKRPLVSSLNRLVELADWVAYAAQGNEPPDDPVTRILGALSDQEIEWRDWIDQVRDRFEREAITYLRLG